MNPEFDSAAGDRPRLNSPPAGAGDPGLYPVPAPVSPSSGSPAAAPRYAWYHKLAGVLLAIFCFEVGVFLLVFPWASEWEMNFFSGLTWGREIWSSPYFRGAISGLGIVNIYLSFVEVFRLRRFSGS